MIITDRVGRSVTVGSFIVYATKTESPSLQFAWVQDIVPGKGYNKQAIVIKIHVAEPNGVRKNKTQWTWDDITQTGEYKDTGKPDKRNLTGYSEKDDRLMVVNPI